MCVWWYLGWERPGAVTGGGEQVRQHPQLAAGPRAGTPLIDTCHVLGPGEAYQELGLRKVGKSAAHTPETAAAATQNPDLLPTPEEEVGE